MCLFDYNLSLIRLLVSFIQKQVLFKNMYFHCKYSMIINYCSSRKKFVSHGERHKEAWDPKGEATKLVGNQNGGPNFVESNIFCWVLFKFLAVFRRN